MGPTRREKRWTEERCEGAEESEGGKERRGGENG